MPTLKFSDKSYSLNDSETILDGLLRQGESAPHSCKTGVCQTCLMQVVEGEVPPEAQKGLKETLQSQGYFLACQWSPSEDTSVKLPGLEDTAISASISEIRSLCHNVNLLRVTPEEGFSCVPGQYLTLVNSDGVARSYSVANLSHQDSYIDLHIRTIPGGVFSNWVNEKACVGDQVHLRGPAGDCFYIAKEGKDTPLLLAGTGTGLAPLYGIILDALSQDHTGPISLFHGALKEEDLYFVEALQELDQTTSNFSYFPCVLNGEEGAFYTCGDIQEIVLTALPEDKKELRIYLCGGPDFVNSMKKKTFLAGAASQNIYSDAFVVRSSE